jgi:hypothetical protein
MTVQFQFSTPLRAAGPLASRSQVASGIPPISDQELAARASVLRPLVVRDGRLFDTLPQDDLREVSYAWVKPLGGEAMGLVAAKTVVTLHTYSYYGFFKPSVAEVLAQAPDDWATYVAFSVAGPRTSDDMGRDQLAFEAGYHVAVTTFYR